MATTRIRTIKPEIWSSPQIMDLSRDARLLFIGLMTQADDEGRGLTDPRRLRAAIFPGDDDMAADRLVELLQELATQRLVELYATDDGIGLYALTGWRRNQKVDHPRPSSYPPPPGFSPDPPARGTPDGAPREDSRTLANGRESSGKARAGSDRGSDRGSRSGSDRGSGGERAASRQLPSGLARGAEPESEVSREKLAESIRQMASRMTPAEIVRALPSRALTEAAVQEMLAAPAMLEASA